MRIVALVLALMLVAPAASAGGWAATYLDPLPRIEAGKTYTVGYWVLQHGNHPFSGDLGTTGLRIGGVLFKGVALPETAHYAVAVSLPAGKHSVYGVQGMFGDHEIGTLTVPGELTLKPLEHPVQPWDGAAKTWGDIKPPIAMPAVVPPPAPAASTTPIPEERPILPIAIALLTLGGAFLLIRRLRKA